MVKMGISGEGRRLVSEVLVRNKNKRNIERVIVSKLRKFVLVEYKLGYFVTINYK